MHADTVVIGLGGNALLQRGGRPDASVQSANMARVAAVLGLAPTTTDWS